MKATVVYLHAITPVHSGTGQTVAVIDLPIAREKATGWPIIPGSSMKGVIRANTPGDDDAKKVIFGSQDQAGEIVLTDQRILCLPVRSFFGTFAWVTCPLVLDRLVKDMTAIGAAPPFTATVPDVANQDACKVCPGSKLVNGGKVYLEDLDLNPTEDANATKTIAGGIAKALFPSAAAQAPDGLSGEQTHFVERFAIVSDELFSFLSENGTEIAARIALDPDTGTTSGPKGNLWYEEAVPAETIFAGAALHANGGDPKTVLNATKFIQIGGNASVGRGLCRVIVG
ncbi:MAG: type III-B CRISPR module RAMP protein Cmr4 [Armatimonadetes bacterium]|nr:type III-B CRISPR module RAMP protein Cmr4 [Armatimonadota bacterium]